jgi:hypothetical protein
LVDPTSRKELQSAWVLLRLGMREAAAAYGSPMAPRINALPAVPPDPASVEPVASHLIEELALRAAEGETSPTIRLLKKTFRPNEAEKTRRNVEKTFNDYVKLWQAQKPG